MADSDDLLTRAQNAQEERARGEGWVPLDEWDGDPAEWVGAQEFNVRGELMKRIKSQSRALNKLREENSSLNTAIKDLADHNKKIAESEKKRVLKELKRERRTAERNEDYELADELEDKIEQVEELTTAEEAASEQQNGPPEEAVQEFNKFLAKHPEYHEDPEVKGRIDKLASDIMEKNPDLYHSPADFFSEVDKALTKSTKKEEPKVADVSEPSNSPSPGNRGGKKKFTTRDLSDEQRSIARRFVSTGAFETEQEYVDQLVEIGELGNE